MPLGPTTVIDEFRSFPGGMNAGIDPADIPKSQLAMLVNGTVRGSFVSDRPPHHLITVTGDFVGTGLFQGACYFRSDSGVEQLLAEIDGKLFSFLPGRDSATSQYVPIVNSDDNPASNSAGPFQTWMWQSEKWAIGQDGQTAPWFYDGSTAVRSGMNNQVATVTTGAADTAALKVGDQADISISAYPGPGGYSGQFNVPVFILGATTNKSIGKFELRQATVGGVSSPTLTAQSNHGNVALSSGTRLQMRTTIAPWTATISSDVEAGPWTAKTTQNVMGSDPSLAIPLSVAYPTGGAVGDKLNLYYKGFYSVSVTLVGISDNRKTVYVDASAQELTIYLGTTVTGITHTFKPSAVTLTLSKPFPGGAILYFNTGDQFSVNSFTNNTVTIDVTNFNGTLAAGTVVTNVLTPDYTATDIGGLTSAVTVSGLTKTNIALSPTYTGGKITVYDTQYNYPWYLELATSQPTTSIQIYVVSIVDGTTVVIHAGDKIILSNQLPVGRMGAYIMGRNFISLPDGVTFIASDATGESSGSAANSYRDAVLFANDISELTAGTFSVPGGSGGRIVFIAPCNQLDASLGQGPVQIGTPTGVFSCNLPVNTDQWQTTTAPLLTQTVIGGGGVGQWSAVTVNDDLFYRSSDGQIRSLKLSRQDFSQWGQVPCSAEVQAILAADDRALLPWCSGCQFDNRLLMTTGLKKGPQGTYGEKTVAINFDRVSSLAGKAPSIYDGVWDGINVLQYVTGSFGGQERCFAFCYDDALGLIALYEILPSPPKPQTKAVTQYEASDSLYGPFVNSASIADGSDAMTFPQATIVSSVTSPTVGVVLAKTLAQVPAHGTMPIKIHAPHNYTLTPGTVLVDITQNPLVTIPMSSIQNPWVNTTALGTAIWEATVVLSNSTSSVVTIYPGDILTLGAGTISYVNGGKLKNAVSAAIGSQNAIELVDPWTLNASVVMLRGSSYILTNPASGASVTLLAWIKWRLETGRLLAEAAPAVNGGKAKRMNQLAALTDGELYLKDLQDNVTVTVYFRPDYSWNWILWRSFTIPYAAKNPASFCRTVGLGEPTKASDPSTRRPWREGYSFQIAIEIQGHATLMGGRLYADVMPTPAFAPLQPFPALAVLRTPLPPAPPTPPTPTTTGITIDGEPLTIDGEPVTAT